MPVHLVAQFKSPEKNYHKEVIMMKKGSTKIDIKNERERVNDFLKVVHSTIFYGESCGA